MEYRQIFGTFPSNNIEPYSIKIVSSTDEEIPITFGNMANYEMKLWVNVLSGDSSFDAPFGYLISRPNGKYKVTYKMVLDGIEQSRTELMDFYPPILEPPPLNNNNMNYKNEEEEPRINELANKENDPDKKRMYKLLHTYQLGIQKLDTQRELGDYIELFWPKLEREIIVFRGQSNPFVQEIYSRPGTFFSTSLHELISTQKDFMSHNNKCCLFLIHVQPGVQYFSYVGDIDKAIEKYNEKRRKGTHLSLGTRSYESEVLIASGGKFYKDREKNNEGFRELTFEEIKSKGITNMAGPYDVTDLFGPMLHKNGNREVEQKTGVFEAYYFPPEAGSGGSRKKQKKTRKSKSKSRLTKKNKV